MGLTFTIIFIFFQAVKDQYPDNKGYVIKRHKCFKFKESKIEPYIHLKITVPEDKSSYTIGMDPVPAEVYCY